MHDLLVVSLALLLLEIMNEVLDRRRSGGRSGEGLHGCQVGRECCRGVLDAHWSRWKGCGSREGSCEDCCIKDVNHIKTHLSCQLSQA